MFQRIYEAFVMLLATAFGVTTMWYAAAIVLANYRYDGPAIFFVFIVPAAAWTIWFYLAFFCIDDIV